MAVCGGDSAEHEEETEALIDKEYAQDGRIY